VAIPLSSGEEGREEGGEDEGEERNEESSRSSPNAKTRRNVAITRSEVRVKM